MGWSPAPRVGKAGGSPEEPTQGTGVSTEEKEWKDVGRKGEGRLGQGMRQKGGQTHNMGVYSAEFLFAW